MFGVTLPEIHGQVHPLTVLLLHLVPAGMMKQSTVAFYYPTATKEDMWPKLPENLHKDVVFFHYLVEAVISSVDFMEPVIVNICHHHLERRTRERLAAYIKDRAVR